MIAPRAKAKGIIGNHSSYDEIATKIDKLRSMPSKPNPFFTGTDNALRYLRVLKECNLNNAGIEKAQGKGLGLAAGGKGIPRRGPFKRCTRSG